MMKVGVVIAAMALPGSVALAQSNVSESTAAIQKETIQDLDAKYATDLLQPGSPAPDIAMPTIDGGSVSIADYKGKYVVLDFWASWCPDCRKDAPKVVAMYNKFHAKGVEFLGVSFDTKRESWRNGVEKLGIPYAQAGDMKNMRESEIAEIYRIKWIPTIYVIDPEGRVALATVMSDKVDALLHSVYPDCAE